MLKRKTIQQAQKIHTATQSHLDFLVRSSNDSITCTDLNRNITIWNPSAEKLYGYKKAEILGKKIDLIIPPDKYKEISMLLKKSLKGEVVANYETERIRKDGKLLNVSITISPVKNDKNKLIGFSTITRDITRQKRLEENLKIFKEAFEATVDAVQIVALDGKILFYNKATQTIYGYSKSELRGKSISILYNDRHFSQRIVAPQVLKRGSWSGEVESKRSDGTVFTVWLITSVIKHNNKPIAFIRIARDITEIKKLENLKADFLSTAAHELRTPLTTLKLISEAHLRKYKKYGKDQIKLSELNLINLELNKLNLLINDILDDSRVERGKLNMHFTTIDLNKLIQQVTKKMKLLYKHHNIVYKQNKNLRVIADPARIEQVMINLISNAVKYSPIFTNIIIILDKDHDGKAIISVRDEGQGIPKEKQELIFDRFYQVKEHSSKGFGLGLYISREIIRAHKGKLWVDSKVEKGSTFYFTLQSL